MKLCLFIAFCGGIRALTIPESNIEKRSDVDLLTDINQISTFWGQISTYADNPEDYFGVEAIGLPDGCQIVRTILGILNQVE